MGMHNLYLRQKMLVAVEQHASMQEQLASRYGQTNGVSGAHPSAPPQENIPSAPPSYVASVPSSAPSAPPIETFQSTECCVCMERKVRIKFIDVGVRKSKFNYIQLIIMIIYIETPFFYFLF